MKFKKKKFKWNSMIFFYFWNLNWLLNMVALVSAAFYGNTEIVHELLSQKDIDINIKNIFKLRNAHNI